MILIVNLNDCVQGLGWVGKALKSTSDSMLLNEGYLISQAVTPLQSKWH